MDMKKITLLCLFLGLSGCATTGSNKPTGTDTDEPLIIQLPPTPKEQVVRSPFFNTQKSVLSPVNGFTYEFYYGSGGRYIVVVKPPNGMYLDFANAEATLTVGAGELNPEILSLSVDRRGIFQGVGDTREGLTNFSLHVFVPSSRYNSSVDENIDFKIKIGR